ncbi:MAG: COX15/CtaA family protein [Bacteroidota bacterium]
MEQEIVLERKIAQKKKTARKPISRAVRTWLFIGVAMVLIQVIIGGVTRLTDSGLSITEWAVIQGTIPPLNEAEWITAFEQYKVAAKKQYETLHADMTLSGFKVIYFWEYFHRLWARTIGFVFLFPFIFFVATKQIPKWLMKRLGITVGLAAVVATFGWIMVASGLNNDNRTWVSAYKLVGHLSLATILFGYLTWTWFMTRQPSTKDFHLPRFKKLGWGIAGVLMVQIVFGGLMAGMRAGLLHPYFPFFVEGERLVGALNGNAAIINYEGSASTKAMVQILHRSTAYILSALIVYFFIQLRKVKISKELNLGNNLLLGMLGVQFLLGVLTIINCFGKVPIAYGAMHQAGALILLAILLYVNFQFGKRQPSL